MAALRAALIANIFLHEENERLKAQIYIGYARGQVVRRKRPLASRLLQPI
jgi:hypothetical protein